MIVYSDVVTKPNSSVSWNKCMTKENFNYIVTTYYTKTVLLYIGQFNIDIITSDISMATTQNTTIMFSSMEAYEAYNNDPVLASWRTCVQNHNDLNGIVKSNITVTEFSQLPPSEQERLTNYIGTFGLYDINYNPISITNFEET